MVSFAEIVKTVDHLSSDELDELRDILRLKKEKELFDTVQNARQESAEGKTIILSSEEETKAYFKKLSSNED